MLKRFLLLAILTLTLITSVVAQTYSLRVREVDGSPDQPGVRTLIVSNGTLSCTGTTCTITTGGGGGGGITIGTTTITSGTTTRVLYNNAGVVGEYVISGTGSVAMTTSPTFTTPALGTPSAAVLTNATGLPPTTGIVGWPANAAGALTNDGAGVLSWSAAPVGANPTATIGLSAVNGVATTFLRSDGAPALSQAIVPTWTGVHIHNPAARSSGVAPYHQIIAPADTGMTANTEFPGIVLGGDASGATVTRTGADGTTYALQREIIAPAVTLAYAGATTATLAIGSDWYSPIAGTNATLTKSVGGRFNASNAAHVPLVANGATSQSANLLETQINGSTTGAFIVTSTGAPHSPGTAGSSNLRYGSGSTATGNSSTVIGVSASDNAGANNTVVGASAQAPASVSGAVVIGVSTSGGVNGVYIGNSASNGGGGASSQVILGSGAAGEARSNSFVAGSSSAALNDVYFGKGITNATPTAYTINGTGGSGSNIAGADLIIAGGKHTGSPSSVTNGKVRIQTSVIGASASTPNSLVDRVVVANRKTLTDASAVSLFDATCASNSACGGTVEATIIATDGTEYQTRTAIITYQAVNKAGTLTSSVTVASETAAVSSGTLTGTWSASNGAGKITIQLNADSSLTTTSFYVIYQVKNNSEQAIAIL